MRCCTISALLHIIPLSLSLPLPLVPKHIQPPSAVQIKNGFSALVRWAPPTGDVRGLIDRYELRAYQRGRPDEAPVVQSVRPTDTNYTGNPGAAA